MANLFRILISLSICIVAIHGHGYLLDPAARSTAWLVDASLRQCCTYPNHMEMFCGGIQHQWKSQGGKCGICGEPYDRANKLFEKGGIYYTGKIMKTYRQGQQIDVQVVLTANHKGYFEFRVCNVDPTPDSEATQACLDRTLLKVAGTESTRFPIDRYGSETITARMQLPAGFACKHCVFQWKYTSANNWGTDPVTGQSGLGMGIENETFMGCADISIVSDGTSTNTLPPVVVQTNPPTAATTARPTATNPPPVQTNPPTAATTARPTATNPPPVQTNPPPVQTTTGSNNSGVRAWSSSSINYKVGDVVIYNGVQYRCVYNHMSYPGAEPGIYTWAWWQRI